MRSKQIEVIVRGVCARSGHVLLCHTRGARNTYLPGGHVEFREKAVDALAREIKEELGIKPRVGRFLGAVEHTFVQRGERHCEINLIFALEVGKMDVSRSPPSREGYIDFRWIPMAKLRESKLEPSVLRMLLPSWLKRDRAPARWASAYMLGHRLVYVKRFDLK